MLIANPVEIYSSGAMRGAIERDDVRAAVGGVGTAKASANYAASLRASNAAVARGLTVALWLDAREQRYIQELSGMNLFAVINGELHTPALDGAILPGITRDSLITLGRHLGYTVQERAMVLDEMLAQIVSGECTEVFACGTAAILSPIGLLKDRDRREYVPRRVDAVAAQLREALLAIQERRAPDSLRLDTRRGASARLIRGGGTGKVRPPRCSLVARGLADDLAVLHDEIDLAQAFDILEGIGGGRDNVRAQACADAAARLIDAQQLRGVRGHGAQNIHGRNPGRAPDREIVEHQIGPRAPGHVDHRIAAEGHAHTDPIGALEPIDDLRGEHRRFRQDAPGGSHDVEMGARKVGADEEYALVLHSLHLRVGQIEAMLDRVHPGFDGVFERIAGVHMHGHGNAGAMCFIDRGAKFFDGIVIRIIVRDQFDHACAIVDVGAHGLAYFGRAIRIDVLELPERPLLRRNVARLRRRAR
jgi:hypothetical protein